MKTKELSILLPALLIFLGVLNVQAQTEPDTSAILWKIETTDDNVYFGEILERDENQIRLETRNIGTVTLQMRNIRNMMVVSADRIIRDDLWPQNSLPNRYFLLGSGYGLKKGEAYYRNSWIFFNQFEIGLSDYVSVGGGLVPTFLFAGAPTPVWITPKVSIPVAEESFQIGLGSLVGGVIGEDTDGPFGFLTGVATVGSSDSHFSLGVGYGFAAGEWAETPLISLSGMQRIGKKSYLITENYLITGDGGLISFGGRSIWNKIALDYGGFIPVGDIGEFFVLPWLGVTLPLNSNYSLLRP